MYLQKAIIVFEELKKYRFTIRTQKYGDLILEFHNHHFNHLFGIQYMPLNLPNTLNGAANIYKYLTKKYQRFEKQIELQFKDNQQLEDRVKNFEEMATMLSSTNLKLYKQHTQKHGSKLKVNYILYSEQLGLKMMLALNNDSNQILSPASWMVESRQRIPYIIDGLNPVMPVTIIKQLKQNSNLVL